LIPLLVPCLGHGLRQHGGEGVAHRPGRVFTGKVLVGEDVHRLLDPLGVHVLGPHRFSPRRSRTTLASWPGIESSVSRCSATTSTSAGSITTSGRTSVTSSGCR